MNRSDECHHVGETSINPQMYSSTGITHYIRNTGVYCSAIYRSVQAECLKFTGQVKDSTEVNNLDLKVVNGVLLPACRYSRETNV